MLFIAIVWVSVNQPQRVVQLFLQTKLGCFTEFLLGVSFGSIVVSLTSNRQTLSSSFPFPLLFSYISLLQESFCIASCFLPSCTILNSHFPPTIPFSFLFEVLLSFLLCGYFFCCCSLNLGQSVLSLSQTQYFICIGQMATWQKASDICLFFAHSFQKLV